MPACNKIRHIVELRQLLRRWRKKAAMSSRRTPSPVPAGHVAVCVGINCRRFVVRATYLNHPLFKKLLVQVEEEYGFTYSGPLAIPCDELVFEEIIRCLARSDSKNSARFTNLEEFQRYCHVGLRSNLDFWPESLPLLIGSVRNQSGKLFSASAKKEESTLILTRVDSSELVRLHSEENEFEESLSEPSWVY